MSTSSVVPSTTPPSAQTATGALTTSPTQVPYITTFTSTSKLCVATLEAQILANGNTAVVAASDGAFITISESCHYLNMTSMSSSYPYSSSSRLQASSSSSSAMESAGAASAQSDGGTSPGIIAGLVLGVVAVLSCLGGIIFWLWLRRRRNNTTIFTAKAKMLEEDRSGEIAFRWEKDSSSIKESDCAEIKEMSGGPLPVEMGDGRSIQETDTTPLSPISIDTSDGRDTLYGEDIDDIVSPLSPNR